MDIWIKKKPEEVRVGDICKRNTEWDHIVKKHEPGDIELNGWYDEEEFVVVELRPYNYVRCHREWVIYDKFDWSVMYDENEPEDKKVIDEMGRDGDKRENVFFNIPNMLWLSTESMRERELKKILEE